MNFAFRNAWREIRNSRSFCIFYIINLALGLIGFLTVDSFKTSLEYKVEKESKNLLGADFAIRARRHLTTEETEKVQSLIPDQTKEIKVVDFYSMVAGPGGRSRLVKVVAMDPGFPFYGQFDLKHNRNDRQSSNELLHQGKDVWIYPELRKQLDVDIGEMVSIGETKFKVTDLVMNDAGLQFQPAELAPKVFISKKNLADTKLLLKGNTAFHNSLFKLPDSSAQDKLMEKLDKAISTSDVRVYSHQKAGHRAGRLLNYLSDFLSLVSMVALFLATIGSGYLFHGFIVQKTGDIAILLSLGASKKTAVYTYVIQLMILGIVACLPALLAVLLLLPILSGALQGLMPSAVQIMVSPKTVLLSFLVAILAGWLLALPSLRKIKYLNPADLFREAARPGYFKNKLWFLSLTPGILAFWGLTVFQANSWKLGNLFFACFIISAILLFALSGVCLKVIEKIFNRSSLPLRLATRSLSRNRSNSVTGFLALGLGVLLLNLIPQFQFSLENEIGLDDPAGKLPKLFLFDIQEDQVNRLEELLTSEGHPLENLTPWVRGKLLKVKGEEYKITRTKKENQTNPDQQRRNNFRNRSFNLSYRDHLLESEEIVQGRMVALTHDPDSGKPVEVSIEQKYAKSMGLGLGDSMEIEVGGIPISSEVVNVRRVRWTSFQPNFFVQMQPGVLDHAPKTFIATLNQITPTQKEKIQDLLVRKFPTISILDVERTGKKILSIVEQMTWALQIMALLSILAGLVILYSISCEKARDQRWEINLMKVLGASFKDLRNQVRFEFGLLGFCASILGVSLSTLVSFVLSKYIFDKVWSLQIALPLFVIVGVVTLSVLTAEWATKKVLAEKPSSVLQEN